MNVVFVAPEEPLILPLFFERTLPALGDQVLAANHSLLPIAQKTSGVLKPRFTSAEFLTRDQNYSSASDHASLLMPDNFRLVILVPLTYMSGMRQAYSIGRGGTVVGGALSLLHSHAPANFSSRGEEKHAATAFIRTGRSATRHYRRV